MIIFCIFVAITPEEDSQDRSCSGGSVRSQMTFFYNFLEFLDIQKGGGCPATLVLDWLINLKVLVIRASKSLINLKVN